MQRAAHGLGEAAGDRQAEADAVAPRGVAVALERGEDALLGLVGDARAAVHHAQLHPVGEGAGRDQHRLALGAVLHGVLHDVGDRPLQQSLVRGHHGQALGDVQDDRRSRFRFRDASQRQRNDLVQVDLPDQRGDGAGLQAGHVEQVADEVVEAVGALLDRLQELGPVLLRPLHVRRTQRRHRRLDPGERGAQVVADGGEQRGADAVALGQFPGPVGLGLQPPAVQDDGGLGRERGQDAAVGGGQHATGDREHHVVAGRHDHVGVLRPRHGGHRADAAGAGPRRLVVLPLQQGRGLHDEGLAHAFQQRLQAGLAALDAAGEEGQGGRLGAQPGRLVGTACREADHGGHGDGDAHEDAEGDDVLRRGDGEGPHRGREVPVDEQRPHDGGGERGPHAAQQRRRDGEREEQQHVVGQAHGGQGGAQQQGQQDRAEHAGQPSGHDPGPAQRRAPRGGQAAALAHLVVGDEVDVQVGTGFAGHGGAHAGAEHVLPALAPGHAEHDLGGVHPARELQQGGGDVVADHVVEAAAQILDEGALDGQFAGRGGGQPVAAGHVEREDLPSGALLREAHRAPYQRAALGSAGQADDDALARAPDGADAVLAAVALEVGVDAVRHPEQGQLAQGGEIAGAEVVGQGRVDLVGRVDVAVRHPAAQGLGGHVDQFDLFGPAHHLVRHGLPLAYARDGLDDVAEGLQVLDVHRGDDVDAGREQLLHVLPALGVAGARDVGVGELVDEDDLGAPGQHGVQVHLRAEGPAVLQPSARHLFQAVEQGAGAGAVVVLHGADHAVGTAGHPAVRLGQHGVGLADARCRAEVDPECAACHGLVFRSRRARPPRGGAASSVRRGRAVSTRGSPGRRPLSGTRAGQGSGLPGQRGPCPGQPWGVDPAGRCGQGGSRPAGQGTVTWGTSWSRARVRCERCDRCGCGMADFHVVEHATAAAGWPHGEPA